MKQIRKFRSTSNNLLLISIPSIPGILISTSNKSKKPGSKMSRNYSGPFEVYTLNLNANWLFEMRFDSRIVLNVVLTSLSSSRIAILLYPLSDLNFVISCLLSVSFQPYPTLTLLGIANSTTIEIE